MSFERYDVEAKSDAGSAEPLLEGNDDIDSVDVQSKRRSAISWSTIPSKRQLAAIFLARFADFFQMSAMHTIMVHQLRSYSQNTTESSIIHHVGVLQGSCSAAQVLTAMLWGYLADRIGRKRVLLIGLIGAVLSGIGIAFSRDFVTITFFNLLGGALNGGSGVSQTMIVELVDRQHLAKAFLLPGLAFYTANILGPIAAGLLSPAEEVLTSGSYYPYAPPALLSAALLSLAAIACVAVVDETMYNSTSTSPKLEETHSRSPRHLALLDTCEAPKSPMVFEWQVDHSFENPRPKQSTLSELCSARVMAVIACLGIFDFHTSGFNSLWIMFLTADQVSADATASGLDFSSAAVGLALSLTGIFGIGLLFLYPYLNNRLGLLNSFRAALGLFPAAYVIAPLLAVLPMSANCDLCLWLGIAAVTLVYTAGRTFALPSTSILISQAVTDPARLGTLFGIAQSVSSASRALGPPMAGLLFNIAQEMDLVAMSFWTFAMIAVGGFLLSLAVRLSKQCR